MINRWRVVVGGVSMNLALGSLYAWSVFVPPLEKEFGWTRAQTSWVYTIAVVTFAATFVIAGRIQDARGPRLCAFAGALLVSLGFFLASFTGSLWFLYLTFGLLAGAGNGFGYATPMPVASKWFPDRRGLVVGLMVGGYGAGSAIIGPIATALISSVGWRATFRLLGAAFFVMGMIGTWLLTNPPEGYRPAGWTPPPAAARRREFSAAAMLRTPQFYQLWIAYCLGATAGQMTISQLIPFARSAGLGAAAATLALPVTAAGNAGGRILSGWLSDGLGRLPTLRIMVLALGRGDAGAVSLARAGGALFRARRRRVLVLRHAVVGVRVDDCRPLWHAQPRVELRHPVHCLGGCRHSRPEYRRAGLRRVRRLPLRVLRRERASPSSRSAHCCWSSRWRRKD